MMPHALSSLTQPILIPPLASTRTVGEETEEGFYCGNGVLVLGGDGYIYAANRYGQVLKIDVMTNSDYTWIGNEIYSGEIGAVTLLLELISVSTGFHTRPIVYSNLIPRHNNCHRSWGMTWAKDVSNGRVEL
jgi:hypothetical protein